MDVSKVIRVQRKRVTYDVAVHQPRSGIVSFESDDKVARCWQHRGVAARRVVKLESNIIGVLSGTLSDDEEVMAVQMDGMGYSDVGADNYVDEFVLAR